MEEEFRDITGTSGIYQISNLGRVRSTKTAKPKILKGCVNQVYRKVHLNKQDRNIHVLVAEAFLGHTLCGYAVVVKHKDGDRLNNRLDNLELVHHFQDKSKRQGLNRKTSKYVGVSWAKKANKWLAQITANQKVRHLGHFADELEASEAYQTALKSLTQ
jgi:hypothetical protein